MAASGINVGSADSPPFRDFSLASLGHMDTITSPSQLGYPPFQNSLMLPREWPESYHTSSAGPVYDIYDFQSNHPEPNWINSGNLSPAAVSGLGIRNVGLAKDTESIPFPHFAMDGSYAQPVHERRAKINWNYRTDSVYDGDDRTYQEHDSLGRVSEAPASLGSPWSFSSIVKVDDLATETIFPDVHASSSYAMDFNVSSTAFDSEADSNWTFEKLSAATGLSVADLAAQISATAETTLKRMSESGLSSDSIETSAGQLQSFNGFQNMNQTEVWLDPSTDFPMRDNIPWNEEMGVNPADIMAPSLPSTPVVINSSEISFIGEESISQVQQQPITETVLEEYPSQYKLAPRHGSPFQAQYRLARIESSSQSQYVFPSPEQEPQSLPSPSTGSEYSYLPPQPTYPKRSQAPSSRGNIRRKAKKNNVDDSDHPYGEYPMDGDQDGLPPIDLGTPVFDAHRGMDLEELKAKAERYRLRNQGRDYDKRWLISFAGKLSAKGELVDEFRCYVSGCKQSNKRRDHILIHVGAHLDQRPFKCIHWYVTTEQFCLIYLLILSLPSSARFLRKNECKRHELSHTGIRPFSCHLCPSPTITFVRQDLLKRHMKRTHRQDLKADKENSRPKKRARH